MNLPLIVILGPTASGKTGYAINLAQRIDGEIICADSRTVYKGMDVGTAKPTKHEREIVLHWALDLVEPDQRFTLYDFQQLTSDLRYMIFSSMHIARLPKFAGVVTCQC